jgi:hypothetical protein
MATLALPICELEPAVIEAKAETERVVSWSKSSVANLGTTCQIYLKAIILRQRFSRLVALQSKFLGFLVERDFSDCSRQELRDLAECIDRILAGENELLGEARSIGSEIRVLWTSSLQRLSEQAEHLDSISESLHMECQPEGPILLAVAAGQFAM